MADETVKVTVEVDGAQQSARAVEGVAQSLEHVHASAQTAARSTAQTSSGFAEMARGGQNFAQRIQGVAGAVQGLVGQLGSRDRTAGLVASVAGATAQFAAMGSMLGPAGTVIGGIIGFASGIAGVASANREARPEIEATTERIREEGEAASTASDRMRDFLESLTTSSRSGDVANLANQITELTDEMYRLRDAGDGLGAEVIAERIRTLSRFESADRANIAEETRTTGSPRTGGGGGGEDPVTEVDFNERYREERAAIMSARLEMTRDMLAEELEAELAHQAAIEEVWRESADRELDLQNEVNQALADAEREHQDRIAEGRQAMKDAETESLQRQRDEREKSIGELTDIFGQTANALGGAIKEIATGEKSAEEAFKGLGAAFLEMISQYATMKAGVEFADAAASFARYDFGGGAAHIGAGLAFTAVAVATGVGAAALNSPPSAPARPESAPSQGGNGARGGDTVVNFNSPIVTAATEAELGRRLSHTISMGADL